MISVVIPTLNAGDRLPECLNALIGPAVDGLVREVILVDCGSTDNTIAIAEAAGARVIEACQGRGFQLHAGGKNARSDWLMFLHGDTVLEKDWAHQARRFIDAQSPSDEKAGVFTLGFDKRGLAPTLVATGAMIRTRLFNMPFGDQGLLISRRLYDAIGGYGEMILFEDVDIVERIKAHCKGVPFHIMSAKALTSAERYERDGYLRRVLSNFFLQVRYRLGASPEKLANDY